MDSKTMITSRKQRLEGYSKGSDTTGGHEVGGSSPLAPTYFKSLRFNDLCQVTA